MSAIIKDSQLQIMPTAANDNARFIFAESDPAAGTFAPRVTLDDILTACAIGCIVWVVVYGSIFVIFS